MMFTSWNCTRIWECITMAHNQSLSSCWQCHPWSVRPRPHSQHVSSSDLHVNLRSAKPLTLENTINLASEIELIQSRHTWSPMPMCVIGCWQTICQFNALAFCWNIGNWCPHFWHLSWPWLQNCLPNRADSYGAGCGEGTAQISYLSVDMLVTQFGLEENGFSSTELQSAWDLLQLNASVFSTGDADVGRTPYIPSNWHG